MESIGESEGKSLTSLPHFALCDYDMEINFASAHGSEEPMIGLKVNGQEKTFDGDPDMPLLWYLRDVAQLTGTKFGCGMALCGACTVHRNGAAIRSCITPMSAAADNEIRTIEDLGANGLHPV